MPVHRLNSPLTEIDVRALKAGDHVLLDGEIVITAGLPTHARILDCIERATPLPIDLRGASFFHLGSYSEDANGVFRVRYMNPTTSTRFNHYMPRFISAFGLRAVGGKGGLDTASASAMKAHGCVYLSFLGGGCALLSESIVDILAVGWSDLVPHYRLVKMRVRDLGPLVVAIDAHGTSTYDLLRDRANERLPMVLQELSDARSQDKQRR